MVPRHTFRKMVKEGTYLNHSSGELDALVVKGLLSEEVRGALNPDKPYGVAFYGRTRSYYASPHSKRRTVEPAPRSEWVAVPVDLSGSGLERGKVERARRIIEGNRAPSKGADYEYELSRGFLFCAYCGLAMVSHARRFPTSAHHYYPCDGPRKTRGTAPPCPNRKSHPAPALEYDAVRLFERNISWETLQELFDRAVEEEEERAGLEGSLKKRAALSERLAELEAERRGYLRQNARGVLDDREMDAMLSELDGQREEVAAELRNTEDAASTQGRLRAALSCLLSREWYEDPDAIQPGDVLTTLASSLP